MNFENLSSWNLLVATLSPTKSEIKLPVGIDRHARTLCDGFGNVPDSDPHGVLYDWSHVRDSSDEAIERAAAYVRRYLTIDALAKAANAALESGNTVAYEAAINCIKEM